MEKECERIDKAKGSGSDSDLTDEFDESMKDEAMFEKEKVVFGLLRFVSC